MKKLELEQMETIHGESGWGWLAGASCAIAIAGAVALTAGTFGAGAILGAAWGTAACAISTAGAMHNRK